MNPQALEWNRVIARALADQGPHPDPEHRAEHKEWRKIPGPTTADPMQIICTCALLIDEPTHAEAYAALERHIADAKD